ncbi:TetR/AcrR family transcriptional regulator [Microbacterium sp. NPDC091313]
MTVNGVASSEPSTDRERVVDAATRLFYARGIQAVGMDAVRAESGVPLKRLYAAFPSKESLLLDVLQRRSAQWARGVNAAVDGASTPRDKLLAVYDFLLAWFREDDFRGCAFINAFGELGAVSPDIADAVRSQKHAFQEQVAALVADLGAPATLAPQLALLAEGAQTTAAIDGSAESAVVARAAAEILIDASVARA